MTEIHCPRCGRLLLKVEGLAHVETRCRHCKITVRWPSMTATEAVDDAPNVVRHVGQVAREHK